GRSVPPPGWTPVVRARRSDRADRAPRRGTRSRGSAAVGPAGRRCLGARMRISVVGAGRGGTAVAGLLGRARPRIAPGAGRGETADRAATWLPGVPVVDRTDAARGAEVVLLSVPDDTIAPIAADLADAGAVASGTWVVHLSGAAGLEVLDPLARLGARRL